MNKTDKNFTEASLEPSQPLCTHDRTGGGNDYLQCFDCGIEWDYRKVAKPEPSSTPVGFVPLWPKAAPPSSSSPHVSWQDEVFGTDMTGQDKLKNAIEKAQAASPQPAERRPIHSGSGGVGYLLKQSCPLCGNHTIYEEAPEDKAPTKYYCHGCDKGLDSFGAASPHKDEPSQ